ncbi:RNA 2',3'-cyclic phosphodiesterase [Acetobacteraceae bacterium KSS8]|uniref:RNA 2',3'-cyclic phosphodiesterase n=1 Tax=Endosaccharibacter trunci TaxID=2812733 RepID=A0ABT1W321_9PROT|nr:RNA 2',3'-cyclic phosphodiesterase [Acetobacteraceae bacterium KSS8]
MIRLFVAIDLPWTVRETLVGLCGGLTGVRWTAPENLHLTLRFVGEVRGDVADEVDCALQALRGRRFGLALSGAGVFERGGHRGTPRSANLWAGIARDERLEHLQAKIETALQRAGLPAERRRFQPHVTLARVDAVPPDALAAWLKAHNLLRTEPVEINSFTLFSSQHGPDQPVYTPEVTYELS